MKKIPEILIIEDRKFKSLEEVKKLKNVNIDFATNLEEGIHNINSKQYSWIVTDMCFPESKTFELDFKKVFELYTNLINENTNFNLDPNDFINSIKNNKTEKLFYENTNLPIPNKEFSFLFPPGGFIHPPYNNIRKSLIKNTNFTMKHWMNGITIGHICKEKNIPYSIYTSDFAHSWPGGIKVALDNLANPKATLAALISDFNIHNRTPKQYLEFFKKINKKDPYNRYLDLPQRIDYKKYGIETFYKYETEFDLHHSGGHDGQIIATSDYKFIIGNGYTGKDYKIVVEKILDKYFS